MSRTRYFAHILKSPVRLEAGRRPQPDYPRKPRSFGGRVCYRIVLNQPVHIAERGALILIRYEMRRYAAWEKRF